ncbi:uncharacterized protein LOC119683359 [Teleopsis dalmanni]|uniref:uncharacterized protein LOC119683359 n=1 Tax=Teleopsis dalmanni TaxID=139649 RepID=UPI0018CEB447|nr:uncharacterized protein LOC119683359 [Teleopsis dalmanni]
MKEKVIIDEIVEANESTLPTLVNFQNGELKEVNEDKMQFHAIKYKDNTKGVMVKVNDDVYHGPFTENEHMQNFICIRNKETNKMRLIPIKQAMVNNQVYNELERKRIAQLPAEVSRLHMLKEFGGRKASRFVTSRENMKVNIDMVKDDLDATVNDSKIEQDDPNDSTSNVLVTQYDIIRPKFNAEATKQEQIYDVHDVVPEELLERLEDEAKAVFDADVSDLPINSVYILNLVKKLKESPISNQSILHIKLLVYMDCLLNFIKSRARSMKNVELSQISEKVENHVRSNFVNPNGTSFLRTVLGTEKSICYYIVLALLTSEKYEVDMKILLQDLCVPKAKIVKLAHLVNARVKVGSDRLCLYLPKNMPELKTRKRKSL